MGLNLKGWKILQTTG